jgi:hypothetical protein
VGVGKTEIAREIGAHGVGIEHHCIEQRRQRVGERLVLPAPGRPIIRIFQA